MASTSPTNRLESAVHFFVGMAFTFLILCCAYWVILCADSLPSPRLEFEQRLSVLEKQAELHDRRLEMLKEESLADKFRLEEFREESIGIKFRIQQLENTL